MTRDATTGEKWHCRGLKQEGCGVDEAADAAKEALGIVA